MAHVRGRFRPSSFRILIRDCSLMRRPRPRRESGGFSMTFMKFARKNKGARLGQHFLTGLWAARKLIEAGNVRPDETILEIGPGKGALTKELLATGAKVVAVE